MFSLRTVVVTLLSLLVMAPFTLSAAVIDNLYRVEQPQAEEESRDEALRKAAEVMFTRIGGEKLDAGSGPVAGALNDPRELVRRVSGRDGTLVVEFEPAAVRSVMVQGGLPMLGRSRPGILVWAVEAQTLGDELLGAGSAWGERLRTAASYRGVALNFPLGDLEDRGRVSEAIVRQGQRDELLEASERYSSEGVLAIAFTANGANTRAQWHLWLNDQAYSGRATGDDPAAAADQIMREVAAAGFEQYAIPAVADDDLSRWTLVVQDINSIADYASLQGMLRQLGGQSTPQMLAVDTDQVTIRVDFPGDESQLERMLRLDQRLVRIPAPEPEPIEPEPILLPDPAEPLTEVDPATMHPDESATATGDPERAVADIPTQAQPEPESAAVIPDPAEPDPNTLYYRWR